MKAAASAAARSSSHCELYSFADPPLFLISLTQEMQNTIHASQAMTSVASSIIMYCIRLLYIRNIRNITFD